MNENSELEGKVIQCKYCKDQWIYESQTKYLENRIADLNKDLDNTEKRINLKKKEHQDKISQLENDLKIKKDELEKQTLLQDKLGAFENRLKETEKLSSEETELDNKINKIKNKIRTTKENISSYNKDIEEKTNFLETKINSYNEETTKKENNLQNESTTKINNTSVVDINKNFSKSSKQFKDTEDENDKPKKINFFSPNFLK